MGRQIIIVISWTDMGRQIIIISWTDMGRQIIVISRTEMGRQKTRNQIIVIT